MNYLLARKRSTPSLRRKRLEGSLGVSSTAPSDQKPREEKSVPYRDTRYETLLATKGRFMDISKQGIMDVSGAQCRTLLEKRQATQSRNETRVIRDISLLIAPSAETLATYGAKELEILIESTNEGWNNSIPLTGTRLQRDYSSFIATYYTCFPFFTCEVKCGAAALEIADRQNAYSITLAVRAVVELFRLAGREAEIDREILAFSVSHDHALVRIYGHYPVVKGKDTTFYRHPIRKFGFTEQDGKDKWLVYKFTKSVYNVWMPTHFKRLCSSRSGDGDITPNTSFTGQGASKRSRRKVAK
ncbi:hypothetical protein AOQ84DRAFT_432391 [Glonium stellatum]|uniref:DUF7924 domain-containing protein n=1 Tax=Glonium stellatum TaxID=574774 RepID=A0A8E2EY02_9PEZI|nr:hypothetical protein AOQ84DRAFT_432391 [Glonium stellatum]